MDNHQDAFAIVQKLAAELSGGQVPLPSLPRAVVRLRNELAKEGFDVPKLAKLAATEPALAGSILTMANSVALRRADKETVDLKVAIPRIGASKVQVIAMRFAMEQLKNHKDLGRSRKLLEREWAFGLRVAATGYMVAERSRAAKPDEALIVGLIHNIGRIYLYSRADEYPALFDSPEAMQGLVASWHANVAQAIVESWGLPADAAEAVAQQDVDDGLPAGTLSYVLRIALAITALPEQPDPSALDVLAKQRGCRTLNLGPVELAAICKGREATRVELGLAD